MSDAVFISYSSKDIQTVKQITDALTKNAVEYWKAPEMIPAGSNYAREIPRAIENCSVFLLLVSEYSQDSIWVEKEIDCAVNHRKTIIPIMLTKAPMTDMFRFYLNNVQAISYAENPDEAIQMLLERLGKKANTLQREVKVQPERRSLSLAAKQMLLPKEEDFFTERKQEALPNRAERSNALKMNQEPVVCKYCGGDLSRIGRGVFQCNKCGKEDYDSFQKVKMYLDENGPRSVTEIMRATGVGRNSIEYFLRDERLEIRSGSKAFLRCAGCGCKIRTGVLCETCKGKGYR